MSLLLALGAPAPPSTSPYFYRAVPPVGIYCTVTPVLALELSTGALYYSPDFPNGPPTRLH